MLTELEKFDIIKKEVVQFRGAKIEEVFSRSRKDWYSLNFPLRCRQEIQVFAKKYTNLSLDDIGDLINRNRATYYNSVKKIDAWCATDKRFKKSHSNLSSIINAKINGTNRLSLFFRDLEKLTEEANELGYDINLIHY